MAERAGGELDTIRAAEDKRSSICCTIGILGSTLWDVALRNKQDFMCLFRWFVGFSTCVTNGRKFPTRPSLCSPYATDELSQTYK